MIPMQIFHSSDGYDIDSHQDEYAMPPMGHQHSIEEYGHIAPHNSSYERANAFKIPYTTIVPAVFSVNGALFHNVLQALTNESVIRRGLSYTSHTREMEDSLRAYNAAIKQLENTTIELKRQNLRDTILSFADLPDDFDGDDGHAPDKRDIENALSLLPHIPDAGILSVSPMVAGDGDVGYEWCEGPNIEIGFTHGEISFFGYTPEGERLNSDEPFTGEVPAKLQKLLSALFGKKP